MQVAAAGRKLAEAATSTVARCGYLYLGPDHASVSFQSQFLLACGVQLKRLNMASQWYRAQGLGAWLQAATRLEALDIQCIWIY